MPTIFSVFGLRFLFFSDDHEPVHVHVARGRGAIDESAVFQVKPAVKLRENKGLSATELKLAENLVEENKDLIISRWEEFFKDKYVK
jgi:hypothetical protein